MEQDVLERERARLFPEQVFASPLELALYCDLSIGQRLATLVRWRMKAVEQPASEDRVLIDQIDEAIELLVQQL